MLNLRFLFSKSYNKFLKEKRRKKTGSKGEEEDKSDRNHFGQDDFKVGFNERERERERERETSRQDEMTRREKEKGKDKGERLRLLLLTKR